MSLRSSAIVPLIRRNGFLLGALTLCCLASGGKLAAQVREIGQPWPNTRSADSRRPDIGQPGEAWSLFPAGIGRWGDRLVGSSLLVDCPSDPLCLSYPRSVYRDRAFPSTVPALSRRLDSDWSSTNRSPWFDVGYTAYTSFGWPWSAGYGWGWGGGWGLGWGGWRAGWGGGWGPYSWVSPTGFYPGFRPWYANPYAVRPWWGVYGPYYGGGYASFYRPWYLYAPGSSVWNRSYPGAWGGVAGDCPPGRAGYAGCYYW